jgi:futalosine hydrolase
MKLRERLKARLHPQSRLLVITAVAAERAAVLRGLDLPVDRDLADALEHGDRIVVEAGGVGAAAAAAATGWLLGVCADENPFELVVCAGVAGGFAGRAPVGATVLASRAVAADLGAESPDGLLTLSDLDLGPSTLDCEADLVNRLRGALPVAILGDVLTVATVTGSTARADALVARWPDAVAEAMEGFGVASAADRAGAAFAELRTISNPVGPRDRAAWHLPQALTALEESVRACRLVWGFTDLGR